MAVYVDELMPYGRTSTWKHSESCHMTCDGSFEELHTLAKAIGLRLAWFQTKHNRPDLWHYDVNASKRALAIQHGAIAITCRQYGTMLNRAAELQQSGILRHACGHREEHIDLCKMPEEERLQYVRERMRQVCSECRGSR